MSTDLTKQQLNDLEKNQPKKRRSGSFSKKKGKSGEHYFAKQLSEATGLPFARVPNSGALVGKSNRDRLKQLSKSFGLVALGDIVPPDDLIIRPIFECKNYNDFSFSAMLKGNYTKLNGWIEENLYDVESANICGLYNTIGFLCIKITNNGNYIVFNASAKEQYALHDLPEEYIMYHYENDITKNIYGDEVLRNKYIFCNFDRWLELNKGFFRVMKNEKISKT